MRPALLALLAVAAVAAPARAQMAGPAGAATPDGPADDGGAGARGDGGDVAHRLNLRVGFASTDDNGRPTICLDVRIVRGFGVESCGTGQALLHDEPGTEMAHFRATYAFLRRSVGGGVLAARGALGFAELQVGVDNPGFQFGAPDAQRGSVAGPEAAVSAQWLRPLHGGVDFVVTGTAGLAYFSRAADLVTPRSETQPFLSLEAGVGW